MTQVPFGYVVRLTVLVVMMSYRRAFLQARTSQRLI